MNLKWVTASLHWLCDDVSVEFSIKAIRKSALQTKTVPKHSHSCIQKRRLQYLVVLKKYFWQISVWINSKDKFLLDISGQGGHSKLARVWIPELGSRTRQHIFVSSCKDTCLSQLIGVCKKHSTPQQPEAVVYCVPFPLLGLAAFTFHNRCYNSV